MDAIEFGKDFMENVKSEAAVSGEGKCAVFVNNMASYLVEAEVLGDFSGSFYVGTGKSGKKYRVDGYVFDEFDMSMNLVVADYEDDSERVLAKTGINQDISRVAYFADLAFNGDLYRTIEPSTPCSDLVDLMREQQGRIRKIKILIFTEATVSSTIKAIEVAPINGWPVECQLWSIERLFKVCCSDLGRQNIEINFLEYTPNGIPCLKANDASDAGYQSYLCVIPGNVLADIYDRYGSALLEGNVRSFLSTKVAVNKKIRQTIMSAPDMFFAYNNGVSATAMGVQLSSGPQGQHITSARDFQIINGGQTTASLSNTRHRDKANLTGIFVQMKLTEIDETELDRSNELIRNISRSSNSQNKVSDADFFATAPFHIRMEQFSRRLFAIATDGSQFETHWFYERARGQYLQAQMRLTPAKKKQFVLQNPKEQLITKTDLAKVRNTWRGLPQVVSKGAQTNFMKFAEQIDAAWDVDDTQFGERYFQESVSLMIMYRHLERLIPQQEWYESGYRANVITYTIASFHYLLSKQITNYRLDLMGIWMKQKVPESLSNVLLDLAQQVYLIITDPARKVVNVTQWCKRDECWRTVQSRITYGFTNELKNCLVSRNEQVQSEKEARKDQEQDEGIMAQSALLKYDTDIWMRLEVFATEHHLLSDTYIQCLRYAKLIPYDLPSAFQSAKILELLQKAKQEGFKE